MPSSKSPWGAEFPIVVDAWRRAWDKVLPFFAFAPAVLRVIYTTNAIESLITKELIGACRWPSMATSSVAVRC